MIDLNQRLRVVSRIAAAVLGGYLLANTMIVALSYSLPLPLREGLMLATMLSYLVYPLAIIWVFAVKSLKRAWLGMLLPSALLALLALLFHQQWLMPVAQGV